MGTMNKIVLILVGLIAVSSLCLGGNKPRRHRDPGVLRELKVYWYPANMSAFVRVSIDQMLHAKNAVIFKNIITVDIIEEECDFSDVLKQKPTLLSDPDADVRYLFEFKTASGDIHYIAYPSKRLWLTAKEPLNNKLYNLGNVAQPPPAVYRGKPQPGAAVPHIKLVNVIYFQALTTQKVERKFSGNFFVCYRIANMKEHLKFLEKKTRCCLT